MRAILSVSDKTAIADLGRALAALGVEIYSTGGTLQALRAAEVAAQSISALTSFPEILDGRVKTLHPAVHGGILHRRDRPDDVAQIAEHGIGAIDLVVVNLYPFRETVARPDVQIGEALEQIDIGGPTMLRAAAKNFEHVLVVVDPADYGRVLEALESESVDRALRQELAAKSFAHTAAYDSAIAAFLSRFRRPCRWPSSESRRCATARIHSSPPRSIARTARSRERSRRRDRFRAKNCRSTICWTPMQPCRSCAALAPRRSRS